MQIKELCEWAIVVTLKLKQHTKLNSHSLYLVSRRGYGREKYIKWQEVRK